MRVIFALMIISFGAQAFESNVLSCRELDVDSWVETIVDFSATNQKLTGYPKMQYKYTLNKSCEYGLRSEVEILDSTPLPEFVERLLSPKTKLASSDRNVVKNSQLKKLGPNLFEEKVTLKKLGMDVNIYNDCKYATKTKNKVRYVCDMDAKRSKVKGIFKIAEKNHTDIECVEKLPGVKKCVFISTGRTKSVPIVLSACSMAAVAAEQAIMSTYRIGYYATHGNVHNVSQVENSLKGLEDKIKKHSSFGKATVEIKGSL